MSGGRQQSAGTRTKPYHVYTMRRARDGRGAERRVEHGQRMMSKLPHHPHLGRELALDGLEPVEPEAHAGDPEDRGLKWAQI